MSFIDDLAAFTPAQMFYYVADCLYPQLCIDFVDMPFDFLFVDSRGYTLRFQIEFTDLLFCFLGQLYLTPELFKNGGVFHKFSIYSKQLELSIFEVEYIYQQLERLVSGRLLEYNQNIDKGPMKGTLGKGGAILQRSVIMTPVYNPCARPYPPNLLLSKNLWEDVRPYIVLAKDNEGMK